MAIILDCKLIKQVCRGEFAGPRVCCRKLTFEHIPQRQNHAPQGASFKASSLKKPSFPSCPQPRKPRPAGKNMRKEVRCNFDNGTRIRGKSSCPPFRGKITVILFVLYCANIARFFRQEMESRTAHIIRLWDLSAGFCLHPSNHTAWEQICHGLKGKNGRYRAQYFSCG